MTRLLASFRNELGRIFALRPVLSVMVLAPMLYAVFYPQPYLNEALRDVPIAIVDRDNTASSRELARRVDASADIGVAMVLPDLPNAEQAVFARALHGILMIPKDFERNLLHGRASPIALYADAGYFLIYQRISGGVTTVARAFGAEVETGRLVAAGIDTAIAGAASDPMPLTAVPLFNPQGGYATYLLPAAFVLILQQTLLIGVALLGTLPGTYPVDMGGQPYSNMLATVCGKVLAYLAVEAVILPFYLIALIYFYGVPRLGAVATIFAISLPFVLAVGFLGIVLARIFRRPLAVQLATAAIGLPFFFLAGFAWPAEAMPGAIRLIAALVPSTSAIDVIVRSSQLGAPLPDLQGAFLLLWALAIAYGAIAVLLAKRA